MVEDDWDEGRLLVDDGRAGCRAQEVQAEVEAPQTWSFCGLYRTLPTCREQQVKGVKRNESKSTAARQLQLQL